jgi:hypothetical protein
MTELNARDDVRMVLKRIVKNRVWEFGWTYQVQRRGYWRAVMNMTMRIQVT